MLFAKTMTAYETILYDQFDGIVRITLNRPEVRNAQDQAMLDELDHAVRRA